MFLVYYIRKFGNKTIRVLTILQITRAGLTMCVKLNIASPKYANIHVSENETHKCHSRNFSPLNDRLSDSKCTGIFEF